MKSFVVATVVLVALIAAAGLSLAEEKKPMTPAAKKGIAALDWLAGAWTGSAGPSKWETNYSTPSGGMVVSASKEIRGEKAVMFDYEVFVEREGKIVLTPYPHGNKSKDFTATNFDPTKKKIVLENAKHDFPKKFTYELVKEGHLHITLEGEQGGNPIAMTLKFKRP